MTEVEASKGYSYSGSAAIMENLLRLGYTTAKKKTTTIMKTKIRREEEDLQKDLGLTKLDLSRSAARSSQISHNFP